MQVKNDNCSYSLLQFECGGKLPNYDMGCIRARLSTRVCNAPLFAAAIEQYKQDVGLLLLIMVPSYTYHDEDAGGDRQHNSACSVGMQQGS